jgi:hypothetical protein
VKRELSTQEQLDLLQLIARYDEARGEAKDSETHKADLGVLLKEKLLGKRDHALVIERPGVYATVDVSRKKNPDFQRALLQVPVKMHPLCYAYPVVEQLIVKVTSTSALGHAINELERTLDVERSR